MQKINSMPKIKIPANFETSLNGVDLSFANIREYERTKHVHRLHPYLGKFIPQLVEVFLKHHFDKGNWILDPFLGSGTTLIEANVLGMPSAGIEISQFNCLIAEIKTKKYDIPILEKEIKDVLFKTKEYSKWLTKGETQLTFLNKSYKKYKTESEYLNAWFPERALQEILFYKDQIKNYKNQGVLKIILSRATRSARLIPHYDLARPKKPIREKYYCLKHHRTCEPVNEAMKFINRYSWDTIKRVKEFDKLRTNNVMKIIQGDSREIDFKKVEEYRGGKFDGIFTSPPYVGLIDYHDQHRYAYELFGFVNNDSKEIGPASKGRNEEAKEEYKKDIISVFQNMNRFLKPKAKIFVVVNDRDNLYPEVVTACGYTIEKIYHRPVLMRTERDNTRFSESIYYFVKQ
jgi:DNA modification methylase